MGVSECRLGSTNPRAHCAALRTGRRPENPVLSVGKGITFDTGGISIKPADGMENGI